MSQSRGLSPSVAKATIAGKSVVLLIVRGELVAYIRFQMRNLPGREKMSGSKRLGNERMPLIRYGYSFHRLSGRCDRRLPAQAQAASRVHRSRCDRSRLLV